MVKPRSLRIAVLLLLVPTLTGAQAVKPGRAAPEITLRTLTGTRVSLAQYRGRPVVVSFWGTWCPPCRTEFPELIKAFRANADIGLVVLGVNGRDKETSTKDVQQFVDEFAVPFEIALDVRGTTRRAYRLFGLPTTVFIDTGGIVRRVHTGPIDSLELARGIAGIRTLR
ncbi:MAG: TlpA disulfide reductase family protein [Gemmatimonas sp.]